MVSFTNKTFENSLEVNERPRVLHLVSSLGPSSIPFEVASHIDTKRFEVVIVSFYDKHNDRNSLQGSFKGETICIGAKGKLDIRAFFELYRIIKKVFPSILHVHHLLEGSLGRLFAKMLRVPIIVTTQHGDHKGYPFLGNLLNGLTLNLSDIIICNSENTKNSFLWWENFLISPQKKIVVYNGVDLSSIDNNYIPPVEGRKMIGINPSHFLIGNVGRLVSHKDQRTLIQAIAKVAREIPTVNLVIVGSGELENHLKEMAKELDLSHLILFTGELERSQVYKILHSLDIFVMSSLREGFCNAVAEAMASKKIIVATNVGSLLEVVGNAGKYFSPGDPQALAKAILDLINNRKEWESIAIAGRRRVQEKFTLEKCVETYERLYIDLLEKKRSQ